MSAQPAPPAVKSMLRDAQHRALLRKLDRLLMPDSTNAGTADLIKPHDVPVSREVRLRVQVWDGDLAMTPQIILEFVPKDLRLYPDSRVPEPPIPLDAAGDVVGLRSFDSLDDIAARGSRSQRARAARELVGSARRPSGQASVSGRLQRQADPAQRAGNSLYREIRMHPNYREVLRRCELRRSEFVRPMHSQLELRSAPVFFYLGTRIAQPEDDSSLAACTDRSIRLVQDLMRLSPQFGVGWLECTLDLALNRRADAHLASLYYDNSYTFSVCVELAEISQPAMEDAPFGLAPSMYVRVEHGSSERHSQVVPGSRTPTYEWRSGAIEYDPAEILKLQLFMTHDGSSKISPDDDLLIGQAWLPAPVLPLPRALMHPEVFPLSLGTNVGIVHVSLIGPSVRRTVVNGCVCRCWSCVVPICGSPPCVPACSVVCARAGRGCWSCVTSREFQLATATVCCCFIGGVAAATSGRAGGMAQGTAAGGEQVRSHVRRAGWRVFTGRAAALK